MPLLFLAHGTLSPPWLDVWAPSPSRIYTTKLIAGINLFVFLRREGVAMNVHIPKMESGCLHMEFQPWEGVANDVDGYVYV